MGEEEKSKRSLLLCSSTCEDLSKISQTVSLKRKLSSNKHCLEELKNSSLSVSLDRPWIIIITFFIPTASQNHPAKFSFFSSW